MSEDLGSISSFPFSVRFSIGFEEAAYQAASLCASAKIFLDRLFDFSPTISLYVLSEKDWAKYSYMDVFGMPHYCARRIVISAERAGFWDNMIQLIIEKRSQHIKSLRSVYLDGKGEIDLSPFFSNLAIHELGHAYHSQLPFRFPRFWLQETFANLCNHVCIAKEHPELMDELTVFPSILSQVDSNEFEFTSWNEFEEHYEDMHPINYGWYQGRLKGIAARLFDLLGEASVMRLWNTFALREKELFEIIDEGISDEFSRFILES